MNKTVETNKLDKLLKNYRKRIVAEGWLKSIICGLTVGFCTNIVCATVFLFFGIKLFWICILVFAAVTAIATPLFYFCRFKNSRRQVAYRVDMLGLEERILTMTQFENDDSYMARRQREDAMDALKTVNEKLLKFAVSIPMIIICVVCCVLSVGATTASALSTQGLVNKIDKTDDQYFAAIYGVKNVEMGFVAGKLNQNIIVESRTEPVEAFANDGYVFIGWSDGYLYALRSDVIKKDGFEVYALFEPIEDNEEEDDITNEERNEGNAGTTGSNQSQPGTPEDGSKGDGTGSGDGAGSGSDSASNQVIDGSTYYGNEYDSSLSDAQDSMNSGNNLSGNEKDMIGDYFHNIQK